jgi:LysM repeat protein
MLATAMQQQPVFLKASPGMTPASAPSRTAVHQVAPGDTLSGIAPSMGENWQQLYAANQAVIGANPNLIYPGELLHAGTATRPAAHYPAAAPKSARSSSYTVRRGDTLNKIAASRCGNAYDWSGIAAASSLPDAAQIIPGEHLTLHCAQAPVVQRQPQQQPSRQQGAPARSSSSYSAVAVNASRVSTAGDSSFETCVVQRESGGNPNIWNPSGHWGLFQFDLSTWVSGGGSAADFGHAGVAEQNRVFANVYAARGTEPWAPSDHC